MLSADYMTLNSKFVDTEPQLLELFQSETGLRFFRHILYDDYDRKFELQRGRSHIMSALFAPG